MNNLLKITIGILIALKSVLSIAQTPRSTATFVKALQCVTTMSDNKTSVAFNPNQELYYGVFAGNITNPIETYSNEGVFLSDAESGFDYRGLWWNSNTGTLEGNGFGFGGIWIQKLGANFHALNGGISSVPGVFAPDIQSIGSYDFDADEIWYYHNGSVYHYSRASHTLISEMPITGLPVDISNLNVNSIAYIGLVGNELAVYDYVLKAAYFINKATGAYASTCSFPVTAPSADGFKMSYANNIFWLYNEDDNQWKGFDVVTCTPIITCPSNSIQNNDAGKCETIVNYTAPTLIEGCSPATMTQIAGLASGVAYPVGITTNTFSATNSFGTTTSSFTITVKDTEAPVADLAQLADVSVECRLSRLNRPTASDNCAGIIRITHNVVLPLTEIGTTVVTWTYEDVSGNKSTQNQNVTIVPDATAPRPRSRRLRDVVAACSVSKIRKPRARDNCSQEITVTSNVAFPISTQGTTVVTWTYDDGNGNTSTQNQNVIITDVSAPNVNSIFTYDMTQSSSVEFIEMPGDATVLNLDDDQMSEPIVLGFEFEFFSLKYTTLQVSSNGYLTFNDTDVTVYSDLEIPSNDDANNVIAFSWADLNPNDGGTIKYHTVGESPNRIFVVDFMEIPFFDAVGGNVSMQVHLLEKDNSIEIHTLNKPLEQTLQGIEDSIGSFGYSVPGRNNEVWEAQNDFVSFKPVKVASYNFQCPITEENFEKPVLIDACEGEITGTTEFDFNQIQGDGTYNILWDFVDSLGNASSLTIEVIIADTTAPVVDVVALEDVLGQCEIAILTPPTATDNCRGTINGTHNVQLPITKKGRTEVLWTFTDKEGNKTSQTQQIIIGDTTDPTADTQDLVDVLGQCEVTSLIPPTVTDNCNGDVTVTHNAQFPITKKGKTEVVWTYVDVEGNTATQIQFVVIKDTMGPTADTQDLVDVLGQCEVTSLTPPTATDNCGGIVTVTHNAKFPITTSGTTLVEWTYTDEKGNMSTQIQRVIIKKTSAPIADAKSLEDIKVQCELETLKLPTATDNCGGTITGTANVSLPISGNGTQTEITWTFDDGDGNITTQTQMVIIEDVTAPEADEDLLTISGQSDVTLIAPTATDNCVGTVIATTTDPMHYNQSGTHTITWIFDDGHGNISSQLQTVIISTLVESHGFSPNDDGINDTWTIDGIEAFKNSKVQVFSRSGHKVYEKIGYKNTWDAYSNTGSNKKMMSGAYYFIIEFNKNGKQPKTGWLYINY